MLREANYTHEELKESIRCKNDVIQQRIQSVWFMSPVVKMQMNIAAERRYKKIHTAKTRLRSMDGLFHEHSDIYK